jgi:hypothetical protein
MKSSKNKAVNAFIIGTFVSLYLLVSIISTIHVIDFFKLSNPDWLAISLAIGFELGAAASLAALITLDKMNKTLVWALFIVITLMQMQGNMYYAYVNLKDYQGWVELFNLVEWEPLEQKRLLSAVSGAILPLVALGFIKSLVDYIKPESETTPIKAEDLDEIVEEINHPKPEKTTDSKKKIEPVVEETVQKEPQQNREVEKPIIKNVETKAPEKKGAVDSAKIESRKVDTDPKKLKYFNHSTHTWDEVKADKK